MYLFIYFLIVQIVDMPNTTLIGQNQRTGNAKPSTEFLRTKFWFLGKETWRTFVRIKRL